jgi:hydroxymethylpyrimidine pyrophosphatase-like HAD family hydrolase
MNEIIRPLLTNIAKDYSCVVTQAVSNMLELLPSDCHKGYGVQQLLQYYNITNVCSIGDAENDIEMFQSSDLSIAVQNAKFNIQQYTDMITHQTNHEGGAGDMMEYILSFHSMSSSSLSSSSHAKT